MKTLQQFLESSNPRIPRKKGQPAKSKKHSDYILMKIQKAQYMDSDSKMNQQRDPVLQRLENQIDLMLTRFRQQSQWSSEHG